MLSLEKIKLSSGVGGDDNYFEVLESLLQNRTGVLPCCRR